MKIENLLEMISRQGAVRSLMSRRGFLTILGLFTALISGGRRASLVRLAHAGERLKPRVRRAIKTDCSLAVARGDDPAKMTRAAVTALGGMSRFVRSGDVVVVKPNIGWDRSPQQAANTNPAVVAELVRMCRESGAKTVKVFDLTCNDARRCYANSGIQEAVKNAGGMIYHTDDWKFIPGEFGSGAAMSEWPIFRDAVACDCFINVPIAKNHGLTRLTLSMKNLMGVCGGNRGKMHWNIDPKLVELTGFINPELTVIDAYRILLRNGPSGGNLSDVDKRGLVAASADPVLADAWAAGLFGIKPADIGYIRMAAAAGLGSMDVAGAKLREVAV